MALDNHGDFTLILIPFFFLTGVISFIIYVLLMRKESISNETTYIH